MEQTLIVFKGRTSRLPLSRIALIYCNANNHQLKSLIYQKMLKSFPITNLNQYLIFLYTRSKKKSAKPEYYLKEI
jgi:hypothetical protein